MFRDPLRGSGYDNWKTTPPEPDPEDQTYMCDCGCDEWLYVGDEVYELPDGRRIHEDCWEEFAVEELGAVKRTEVPKERNI